MSKLTILHFPHANLRKKAVPINAIDTTIRTLADDMLETMYAENGIGLAATQVNIHKRMIVLDVSENKDEPRILINPEILSREGSEEMQEGCLSVPGFYETIQRDEKIKVSYLDLDSKNIVQEVDGLLAVCIQHEIDHLNGKLFIDYLSPLKRRMIQKKIHKQKQDKQQHQVL